LVPQQLWLRGLDLNQGPLGYEPNELPDCSTPHLDSNNRRAQGQTGGAPREGVENRPRGAYSGSVQPSLSHEVHSAASPFRLRSLELLLQVGFALTGAGTVLLGCILPQLSALWHLRDKDAGFLLLVQFAASASGSLFVRRNFWRSLSWGYALLTVGALCIFLLQRQSFPTVVTAFAIFGLGLGSAMTSTNMVFGRRYPNRRAAKLALLNFSWSAGAVVCPLLVAHFPRLGIHGAAFGLIGICAAPFLFVPLMADGFVLHVPADATPAGISEAATIFFFALLAFLYVGMEASVGNWMSTYATRATSWKFAGSNLAVAIFWATLLLGRALTPAILSRLTERSLYRAALTTVMAGICFLLVAHSPEMLLAGSAVTGLALAPLFPLILSLFLEEAGESRNAGWVFGTAGAGGATLSWLTGSVSSATGSLRIGLMVPGAAALLMMAMILTRRPR
jgi:MFS transporter, FHS family, glucose/mannose:H+ symporter